MAELQLKMTPTSPSVISNDPQDAESLQTAIEVIIHDKDSQRSLAQLYPVLDASPLTPSLVRLMVITSVVVTNVRFAGSSGDHTAPDTVPLHSCRPNYQGALRKGERQRDLDCSARDPGTSKSSWRTRRRGRARANIRESLSYSTAGKSRFFLRLQ